MILTTLVNRHELLKFWSDINELIGINSIKQWNESSQYGLSLFGMGKKREDMKQMKKTLLTIQKYEG